MSVAEEAHKADVTRALDTERDLQRQLGEMRQERDLALQEKFKAELGAERARCDAENWKAAVSFLCVMLWFGVFGYWSRSDCKFLCFGRLRRRSGL